MGTDRGCPNVGARQWDHEGAQIPALRALAVRAKVAPYVAAGSNVPAQDLACYARVQGERHAEVLRRRLPGVLRRGILLVE